MVSTASSLKEPAYRLSRPIASRYSSGSTEQNRLIIRSACMTTEQLSPLRRHAVAIFFGLTFAVSWTAALLVSAPSLLRHEPLPRMTGLLMFPAMLLGPSLASLFLTGLLEGRRGLRELLRSLQPARIGVRWLAALLIPPVMILVVLLVLDRLGSSAYGPNLFLPGFLFGVPAGLIEEIGWTGFAFPRMAAQRPALQASVGLGLLWSCWHLPVVNFLGAAAPHGNWWPAFFAAFALAMTAMRVLIGWLYTNTRSLLLAQLMHVVSTGSLVAFSASRASAAQEALWYAVYGALLWVAVFVLVRLFGSSLRGASA